VIRRLGSADRTSLINVGFLLAFGVSFGYVEAAVVTYLRALDKFHENYSISHYHVYLNLGFITFVKPAHTILVSSRIANIEVGREAMTIVMLACVAWVAGRDAVQRGAAFLIGFATWDIFYYVWLWVLGDWPHSLLTRDVFFLIPVTWIGPVLTPLVISVVMLSAGVYFYRHASLRQARFHSRF
jgi:hypothetical protein